jgi:hypothetical protein
MMRTIRKALAVAGACFIFVNAHAWDGSTAGVPGGLEVTGAGNFGFRVSLASPVPMCGPSTPGWAYVEPTDSNYSTYVAVILMAKSHGTSVTVYTIRDANGYCRIGHLGAS